MADDERTGSCIICASRDPLPDLAPCCGPCRSRLSGQLRDIPILCDELGGGGFVMRDGRTARPEVRYPPGHERAGELVPHFDQVANVLTAGPMAGRSSAPRVKGSREAPVPISLDRTDLLSDARVLNLTKAYDKDSDQWRVPYPEDQIGHLSVAAILDGWCRDFAETRRESVPQPSVGLQCRYLADRLDWAFTDHAAVDEMAKEIGDLWHVLRRACGLTMPKPEICWGVQCRDEDCSYVNTLTRLPGSQWIECSECGLLLSEDEYRTWVKLLAAAERKPA